MRPAMPGDLPLAVRVPASTSNLGSGFDLLGLALSLYLEVEARERSGGEQVLGSLEGEARCWPSGVENLLLRAFERGLALAGHEPAGLVFHARSEIPVERGLGSSGAAVAAGLALARAYAGSLPREGFPSEGPAPEELALACELEGHPDNSTASLCGGCTLALPHGSRLTVVRQPVHPSIGVALAWPAARVPTSEARAALPARVPFRDAVDQPRRLAMLLEGLRTGDPELLRLGGVDHLHVGERLPLIAGGKGALGAAREAGAWLATVSGSGSALVALGPKDAVQPIARAMAAALDGAHGPALGRVVEPVLDPPRVRRP